MLARGFVASQRTCFSQHGGVHGTHHPAPSARIGGHAFGGGVLAGDVASVTERPGEVRGYVWFSLGVVLGDSKNSGKQVHHSILTWGVRHPWLFPCAQVDPGDGHPKSRRIVLKTSCESTMKSVHYTRTRSIVSDTGLL